MLIRTFTNIHKILITLTYCLFGKVFSETYLGLCAHCSQRLSLSAVIASVDVECADTTSVHCLVRLLMDCVCDSVLQVSTSNMSYRNNIQVTLGNKKAVGLVYCIPAYTKILIIERCFCLRLMGLNISVYAILIFKSIKCNMQAGYSVIFIAFFVTKC